jgi:hypothetical protein
VATFGTINIGDLSNNVYLGSNAGNLNSLAATCNATGNASIGISSAAGLKTSANSEFIGFQCGIQGSNISNSFIAGALAAYAGKSIVNSILIGHSNSAGQSNSLGLPSGLTGISNTISIGTQAGGIGNSNIYIGASTGCNITGSCNLFIGNGLYGGNISPIPTNVSNKLLIGSLIAGDFSTGVVSIGSTNTNAYTSNLIDAPETVINGLTLDVARYARIAQGLSIGCDPGYYTLDVNGTFRATNGVGWLSMSNYSGGNSNNAVVEIKNIGSVSEKVDKNSGEIYWEVTGKYSRLKDYTNKSELDNLTYYIPEEKTSYVFKNQNYDVINNDLAIHYEKPTIYR